MDEPWDFTTIGMTEGIEGVEDVSSGRVAVHSMYSCILQVSSQGYLT